jgi:predicted phage gp36 major capsid-like protein
MSTHSEDIWDDDPFADSVTARHETASIEVEANEVEDDDSLAQELLPADKMSFTVSDAESASWVVRKILKRERARRASRNGPNANCKKPNVKKSSLCAVSAPTWKHGSRKT